MYVFLREYTSKITLKQLTNCNEIWYEHYATRGHSMFVMIYFLLSSVALGTCANFSVKATYFRIPIIRVINR